MDSEKKYGKIVGSVSLEMNRMANIKYTASANFRCLENLRETSLDLGLVHTGREHCLPRQVFTGVREEYIIHFVLSGAGFYSVGGQTWPLSEGQMFLIYPGESVTYGSDTANPWTYSWIGFKGIRADSIVKQCGFSRNRLVLPSPEPEKFMFCIDEMLDHKTITYANDLRRKSCLLHLFAILIEHYTSIVQKEKGKAEKYEYGNNIYVELALDYIKGMYYHGINVSDIADNIGISRAHLNNAFQKELGISIQRCLIDYRMHKAANLLVSTGMSVGEVAEHVGYEDQLTFSRAFKKKFGISPRDYRSYVDTVDNFTEKQ